MAQTQGTPDYCNLEVLQRNRLPHRAYWIPETSILLNGRWDFHYAASPHEAPEIKGSALETDATWTAINVPGHWQLQGHGRPHYTNVIYPFPVCPPEIPTENPTGTYKRKFGVPSSWDSTTQLRLRFDGVDSSYHVWVNGVFVGYSQGSRNPAEFDVSAATRRGGENELVVRVYQWCEASYIEDQDQWWLSGIFRDVHLLAFPGTSRIEDFFIRTDLDKDYCNATLSVEMTVANPNEHEVWLTLVRSGEELASAKRTLQPDTEQLSVEMAVLNPQKWTAEDPNLYELQILLLSRDMEHLQSMTQRIGFRKVELRNGIITVNGRRVLLRGANRHDHHPLFGRAVPYDFMRDDLLTMKRHNINALRTSHYPSHPKLYDLADELGLWVMDEADLECHGFYDAVARPQDIPEDMDYEARKELTFGQAASFTSDNPDWRESYMDRMRQVIHRDKNHPSIIMWSLGNEAFYGQNHAAMYEYGKKVDPGRLIHYEGDVKAATADMFSYMYPSIERLSKLVETEGVRQDGTFDKPVVLCEYAHAMGNGPGWLEDYQNLFRKYPRLQGGFIWEWANHGLWTDEGQFYGYGGDFGDEPNDGTFVMDGLLNSEHKPTPGLIELKKVIQPVKFDLEGDKIFITNEYDFVNLSHLTATYSVEAFSFHGKTVVESGELSIPNVSSWSQVEVALPFHLGKYKTPYEEVFLTIRLATRAASKWAEASHEIAWWQSKISNAPAKAVVLTTPPALAGALMLQDARTTLTITGSGFSMAFDRVRGYLTRWTSAGQELVEVIPGTGAALFPNFWRAPTDNDHSWPLPYWRRFGVDTLVSQLRSFEARRNDKTGAVEVAAHTYLSPPILAWGYNVRALYTISAAGVLSVEVNLQPVGPKPDTVPRVGLELRLPKRMDKATWFGLGPGEAYPDKRTAQKIGIWSQTIQELETPYDVPQERGNRMDTRWMRLVDAHGAGIQVVMGGADGGIFNWTADRHSAEALEKAKHPVDLLREDATLLNLSYKVAGVGTAACGPGVRDDLQVKVQDEEFEFVLTSTSH